MEYDVKIFLYVFFMLIITAAVYRATTKSKIELGCSKKTLVPIGLLIILIYSFGITEQKFIFQSLFFSCLFVLFFIFPFTKTNPITMMISIIAISIVSNLIFYIFNIYFNTFNDKMFPVISELSQDDKLGVLGDLRDKFGVLGDFFGGVFNPILSFASLVLLLGTFFINLKKPESTLKNKD